MKSKKRLKFLGNEKGIAMLVALSAVLIMTFLAVEVGYNTQLELALGVTQFQRLKAYYLAKSGVQISLLRIKVYKTALQRFGGNLGKDKSLLDMIWQLPTAWPPVIAADLGLNSKDDLQKSIKKSFIDGSFLATIDSEGSKIDLTDLASPSPALSAAATQQLTQLIKNRLDEDDDWARDNRSIRADEIVNNIADWMDEDTQSKNGGDENGIYSRGDVKPTNMPMKTLSELHLVKGVTDEIYNILIKRVTLSGIKAVNVNHASKEVIRSIDAQIDDKTADEIIKRRNDPDLGPFDKDSFPSFLQTQNINMTTFNTKPPIPLFFDSEFNFKIKSTGINGRAQREIFAIVYDFDKVKTQLAAAMPKPSPSPSPQQNGAQASPTPTPTPIPTPTPMISISVDTVPTGRSFTVDGIAYTTAQNFTWVSGSLHNIATTTPQQTAGARYDWSSWSDGGGISHSASPIVATNYVANFTANDVTVSGRVVTSDFRGLRNTSVSMTDPNGVVRTATTSSFGFFSFSNIPTGVRYVFRVQSRLFRYAPVSATINDEITLPDFVGLE